MEVKKLVRAELQRLQGDIKQEVESDGGEETGEEYEEDRSSGEEEIDEELMREAGRIGKEGIEREGRRGEGADRGTHRGHRTRSRHQRDAVALHLLKCKHFMGRWRNGKHSGFSLKVLQIHSNGMMLPNLIG